MPKIVNRIHSGSNDHLVKRDLREKGFSLWTRYCEAINLTGLIGCTGVEAMTCVQENMKFNRIKLQQGKKKHYGNPILE